MTITSLGILAIAFGITAALFLFTIAGIWACFKVIIHFTEKDDKFEYHVENVNICGPQVFRMLGEQGWRLIGISNSYGYFIRRTKEKTKQ